MSRLRLILLLLLLVLGAAACRVEVNVGVTVAADGSSVVEVTAVLDSEAAAQLGDPAALRTQDLLDAGWEVDDPSETADGGVVLSTRRQVASPAELPGALAEVGGVDGIFSDVRLTMESGFANVDYDFAAHLELTGELTQFTDQAMLDALGGAALGRTPEEIQAAGGNDPDSLRLTVAVELPGGEPDTNGDVSGDGPYVARWEYPLSGGEASSEDLTSSSSARDQAKMMMLIGGAAAVVVGVGAAIAALVLRRR